MLIKIALLFISVGSAAAALKNPRKLYRENDDESLLPSLYTDPIDGIDYRLPNNTIPRHYDIWLSTDIHEGEFDFEGIATIQIEALEDTQEITLQIRELTILNVKLMRSTGGSIQSNVPFRIRDDVEFLIITPSQQLIKETIYLVEIKYIGTLRDDDAGFYRSSYIDETGNVKWLATTQFESTDARHAFPCYDEPGIRSSFSISIRHDVSYTAISNGPQESRVPDGGNYVVTTFKTIPSVQSYLIAFIVSDFAYIENNDGSVPHRIFAKSESIKAGDADLALTASVYLLEKFEEYVNISYSLDKMDQAAMPDFAAGAMENWGLVTYREPYLLFNEITGRARDRENVIATISHEFAHQWFGNLVSPAWWSYLWLNEGFATLYENHLTHLAYPNERWIDTFLVETVQPVLEVDANPNIRPMTYYVENPIRIDFLFDSVAYSKSGSVLKMFQYAFGEETWRKGLNYYLIARAYNNGAPEHLHENLQRAVNEDNLGSDINVDVIMSSWETQSGFPYITVVRNDNELTFSQSRFMYTNQDSENLWWVPINYVVASNPDFSNTKPDFWLEGTQQNVSLRGFSIPKPFTNNDWIIVNIQQTGYYRVLYDRTLWDLILQELHPYGNGYEKIHLFNRAQLIDDSFHFARAELLDYDVFLGVMRYMEKETDYIPWASANRANNLMSRWLSGSSAYPRYQSFMRNLVEKVYNKYGVNIIDGEQRVDRYVRAIAINLACQAQLPSCLTDTANLLENVLREDSIMAPDLVAPIYCNGMRLRTNLSARFIFMLSRLSNSNSPSERNSIITGLGCTENPETLTNILLWALDPNNDNLSVTERSRLLLSPINMGEESIQVLISILASQREELIQFNLLTTLCSNIAARIHSERSNTLFMSQLIDLQFIGALSMSQVNNYMNNALTILNWQENKLKSIDEFFDLVELQATTTTELETTPTTTEQITPTTTTEQTTTTDSGAMNMVLGGIVLKFAILISFLL
ncbi:CLUMA_CG014379, isoform A [Clunio marinus]|uniref:Aminopeptidase n=1 Tax=Clunio marinus TaxID=568069 RepID=A0A1J1IMJ3_9DIPT|nr:CLUMA_CG014379, isoform A [Clunio marinus]